MTLNGGPFTYNGSAQAAIVSAVGIDGVTPVAGSVTYITYNGSTTVPNGAGTYAVFAEFTSGDPNYYSATGRWHARDQQGDAGVQQPLLADGQRRHVDRHADRATSPPARRPRGGDDVAITLNGVTQPATVSSSGSFSTTLQHPGLGDGNLPHHLRVSR